MIRVVEVRMVEQVEKLAAKLQSLEFGAEHKALGEREIEVGIARAGEDVAPLGAKSRTKVFRGGPGEGTLVKPVLRRPDLGRGLAGGVCGHGSSLVRIPGQVRSLRVAKSRGRGGGRARQDHGKRRARLRRKDASGLPVVQQRPAPG